MMKRILSLILLAVSALAVSAFRPAFAGADIDSGIVRDLAGEDSDAKIEAINRLVRDLPEKALPVLAALGQDSLYTAGGKLIVVDGDKATDALTGEAIDPVPVDLGTITVNNRIRSKIEECVSALNLFSKDRDSRLKSARDLAENPTAESLPLIDKALSAETDSEITGRLKVARSKVELASPDPQVRLKAARDLASDATPSTRQLLSALLLKNGDEFMETDKDVRAAAGESVRSIDRRLALGDKLGQVFTGLSLGSLLLLTAMGLAITYGVMGVINMAHGEFLMIGAYSAFAVQSFFSAHFPQFQDGYLVAALPVGFIAAAVTGMVLERTVIRFLYGRPLETLLATWGLSLILIQAVRTIFGAQNVEVANPSWMSGGVELLPNMILPWNRVVIIGFSVAVLAAMWAILNLTRLGLFVRAVTQNRAMSGCMGVPTGMVDTLAFGLGAGIAGLGGVALSQVSNVGPDMGQGYIIDSFMVVVLGGVGQLAGAVWAALGLGVVSKFLEGMSGAVIAKILVLVFVIVFIQKRPQGMFALKGRTVED
jgi:urea transport system permease protein